MKQIFGPEGRRQLRASWIILVAAIVSAAGFVFGTTQYLQKEKRDAAGGMRRLQEATARVEAIRRERDSLEHSIEVFRTLVERGVMQPERRLEVIEMVNALRARHRIVSVDYEMAPQLIHGLVPGTLPLRLFAVEEQVHVQAMSVGQFACVGEDHTSE